MKMKVLRIECVGVEQVKVLQNCFVLKHKKEINLVLTVI